MRSTALHPCVSGRGVLTLTSQHIPLSLTEGNILFKTCVVCWGSVSKPATRLACSLYLPLLSSVFSPTFSTPSPAADSRSESNVDAGELLVQSAHYECLLL